VELTKAESEMTLPFFARIIGESLTAAADLSILPAVFGPSFV
jgi:hypothetical protein